MGEIVECHSDFAYAERPIAVTWDGQRLEIVKILAEWRTPDDKWFRVLTKNGQEFVLTYREATNDWHIHQP
jgi:hypothetical protein